MKHLRCVMCPHSVIAMFFSPHSSRQTPHLVVDDILLEGIEKQRERVSYIQFFGIWLLVKRLHGVVVST